MMEYCFLSRVPGNIDHQIHQFDLQSRDLLPSTYVVLGLAECPCDKESSSRRAVRHAHLEYRYGGTNASADFLTRHSERERWSPHCTAATNVE